MPEIPETAPSFSAILQFLEGRGLIYSPHPKESRVGFTLGSAEADYRFTIRIPDGWDQLEYIAYCPFRVDNELRSSVAELIARANYSIMEGKFEINMNNGEVRFHLVHTLEDGKLNVKMVERLYRACVFTLDRYFPAFMQHIHAGHTPEDAVYLAELDIHAERIPDEPRASSRRVIRKKPPAPKTHASDSDAFPPITNAPSPIPDRPRKPRSKKNTSGQGELPL